MTNFIIKYRWLIISVCLVAGIALGSLIPLSKTDPEIRNYIPPTMKSRVETDKIEKRIRRSGYSDASFFRLYYSYFR